MGFKDILLHIDSYPEPTPPAAIAQAVRFAVTRDSMISALAVHTTFPVRSNRVADYLIGLGAMAVEEEAKSLAACRASLADFTDRARAAGVLGQALIERADYFATADRVSQSARARDLCIIPLAGLLDGQAEVVQAMIFDSGRPTLVFHSQNCPLPQSQLGVVVLAWDGSRTAARAMSDAMSLLQGAREVRVLTVVNEKTAAVEGLGADVVRHLTAHGANAVIDEVDAAGRRIGAVLDAYLAQHRPDLLVMGAYGRSRLREFILGGATEHMLYDPKTPLFLSH